MIRIDYFLFNQLYTADRLRSTKIGWANHPVNLTDGTYQVIEHDGDVSIAIVEHCKDQGWVNVEWLSEQEYELHLYDRQLDLHMSEPDDDEAFD